jgi:peptidoglycan/LPS O-acetylase OafA/YrhL
MAALTGIRFPLAMWVIFYHLTGQGKMFDPVLQTFPEVLKQINSNAYVAVHLFFVLSGFLLARGYMHRGWSGRKLIQYAAGRWARVYPMYLLSLLVMAPIILQQLRPGDGYLLAIYGFLLHGWTGDLPVDWNTPAWSLSCEVFFYVCFPALVVLLRNVSARGMLAVAALTLVLQQLVWAAGMDGWKPVKHLADFVMGIAAAGIYGSIADRYERRGYVLYLPAIAAALAILAFPQALPSHLSVGTAVRPFNALIVMGLALGGGFVAKSVSGDRIVMLGKATYGMYILHIPILWWFKRGWLYNSGALPFPLCGAIYVAVVVAVSVLACRFVEEPANEAIRERVSAWLGKPRQPALLQAGEAASICRP